MKRTLLCGLLCGLVALAGALAACDDGETVGPICRGPDCGGSEGDDDDDGESRVGCEDDVAPEIVDYAIRLNDEAVESPVTIGEGDVLEFTIGYADADCNLADGSLWVSDEVDAGEGTGDLEWLLPADLPCSSADGDALTVGSIMPVSFYMGNDRALRTVHVVDVCGLPSNEIEVELLNGDL